MSKNKITIGHHTTINELSKFFHNLKDSKKVRARDLGNGQIQLYVRKNSFKQIFTDKLRLGFMVKRDYSSAVDCIKKILKTNGSAHSIKYSEDQGLVGQEFGKHTHDFSANTLKEHLKLLEAQETAQFSAQKCLMLDISFVSENFKEIFQLGNREDRKQTVEKFLHSSSPIANIENVSHQIKHFFLYLEKIIFYVGENPTNDPERGIDHEAARGFAYTWLSAIKNEKNNGSTTSSLSTALSCELIEKETLTDLCNKIVTESENQKQGSKDQRSG
ncbi:MAG: hypothetical protein ACKOAO_11430 [Oxalobacteraceae bacterium]